MKQIRNNINIFTKYLNDICANVYLDLLLILIRGLLRVLIPLHPFTDGVHFIVAVMARMINIWTGLLVPITPTDGVKRRDKVLKFINEYAIFLDGS